VRTPRRGLHGAQCRSQALSRIPIDFGGGCSVAKAAVLVELITTHGLDTAVEIGVHRGRSFILLALAMRA
jgi:predicted O-methyltransferase YrrM